MRGGVVVLFMSPVVLFMSLMRGGVVVLFMMYRELLYKADPAWAGYCPLILMKNCVRLAGHLGIKQEFREGGVIKFA